jgi:tripeptide aminopeptidase
MTDVLDRFLRYVKIDTQSAHHSETYPSTLKQLDLSRLLVEEMRELNQEDVKLDDFGYVTATLPSNVAIRPPPSASSPGGYQPCRIWEGCKTRLVENYDGGDIVFEP